MNRRHPRNNRSRRTLDALPKATMYTLGEMQDGLFGYDRREVRLYAWGFKQQGRYRHALRVIGVPKGAEQDGGGFWLEEYVFTRDFPVILGGWGHPVPPPPYRTASGEIDPVIEEFADMLQFHYRAEKPSALLADFSEHDPEHTGLPPRAVTRTPLIPEKVAEVICQVTRTSKGISL